MVIIGHGVDIAEVVRIADMMKRHGEHFLNRCFTPVEQAYCSDHKCPAMHYAARFAAKEAVLKALGTGWRGEIAWTDVEVRRDAAGKPFVELSGEARRLAVGQGIKRWHLSLSHTDTVAIASAIAEG
ncbi:MAG: holo-ACP synthase [Phycisphaerae bacterium]